MPAPPPAAPVAAPYALPSPTTGTAAPMGGLYGSGDPMAQQAAIGQFLANAHTATTNHDPYTEFLRKVATAVISPLVNTIANNPNHTQGQDNLQNLPAMLTSLIMGNGGQMATNLSNYAGGLMGQFGGAGGGQPGGLGAMQVEPLMKLLSSIQALKTIGQNPYQQLIAQQGLTDMGNRYAGAVGTAAQNGTTPTSPSGFLLDPANDPYGLFSQGR